MLRRLKIRWILAAAVLAVTVLAALAISGSVLLKRVDPYIREQAVHYLEHRFDSDVQLESLHISMPTVSAIKFALSRGRGIFASVEGRGVSLRLRGRTDLPPMFVMKKFWFEVDLRTLFSKRKTLDSVAIDGMEVNVPPKGARPKLDTGEDHNSTDVLINEVRITDSVLRIYPKEDDQPPLEFDLQQIRLESAGKDQAMKYEAVMTNAKPPGQIRSAGMFGPWQADEPGDTPLAGNYDFAKADLGVFDGIAGILHSTGRFKGTLDSIDAYGEANVPDFRLKDVGNPVSLYTRFNVQVDGTNGNTILKPVFGRLGKTEFTTSGGIIKREKHGHRSISLDVVMPSGNLPDLLRLGMQGPPFMEGRIRLKTKIDIPPLSGKVANKLRLDGNFEITQARFLQSKIQSQIDHFSRRGQGKPTDESIVEVPSGLAGSFQLANSVITFRSLSFGVPGADVHLAGAYNLKKDEIDFHGVLKLEANVSETMTGWKRWVLKPIDPFFAKEGAGTLLHIQVTGTSKQPEFGRDHGKKDRTASETLRAKPEK
jgi:hypothetical protein